MDKSHLPILDKITRIVYNSLDGQIIIPSKPIQYVSEIVGIVKQEQATILVVDGAYLVKSERSKDKGSRNWEAISDTSGELTWLAHTLEIPVILVSQANRSGDVAYSNSLAQDSDILIKLDDETEVMAEEEYIKAIQISTMKNRRGSPYRGYCMINFKDFTVYDTKFVKVTT
jgi:replicative DNA helicase